MTRWGRQPASVNDPTGAPLKERSAINYAKPGLPSLLSIQGDAGLSERSQ
jgi:hypothetical protein